MEERKTTLEQLTRRAVWVEWVDSKHAHGWCSPEEASPDRLECTTLGFLVAEDEEAVQVADSASATGCVGCVLTIPREAITGMWEVEIHG